MFCIHKIISSNLVTSRKINKKIMKINLYPRLHIYYKFLGKFDTLDKNIPLKLQKLNFLRIINKNSKDKNFIFSLLSLEFFCNQRFDIKNEKRLNKFRKTLLFFTTLRRDKLFLFLENNLESFFLLRRQKIFYIEDKLFLNFSQKLNFFYYNKFINSQFYVKLRIFSILIFSLNLDKKNLKMITNYYFLPLLG